MYTTHKLFSYCQLIEYTPLSLCEQYPGCVNNSQHSKSVTASHLHPSLCKYPSPQSGQKVLHQKRCTAEQYNILNNMNNFFFLNTSTKYGCYKQNDPGNNHINTITHSSITKYTLVLSSYISYSFTILGWWTLCARNKQAYIQFKAHTSTQESPQYKNETCLDYWFTCNRIGFQV